MNYRETFERILKKFPAKNIGNARDGEHSALMNRFMLDPRITKHIRPYELSVFMGRYDEWDKPEQKDCKAFLQELLEWSGAWIETVKNKQISPTTTNNFTILPKFNKAVRIYLDIITSVGKMNSESIFQKSIYLWLLIGNKISQNAVEKVRHADHYDFNDLSKQGITKACDFLCRFLANMKINNPDIEPENYLQKLTKCKQIQFHAAFVWDQKENGSYGGKSVEKCFLWLDFTYGKERTDGKEHNKYTLLAINSTSGVPYEDRNITDMVRAAIDEATGCYHQHSMQEHKVADDVVVHNAFFQVGENANHEYDGKSIGAAVFCASLCLFLKRRMPQGVFFTGRAGTEISVKGVYDKAQAGAEKKLSTFVIPGDNYTDELRQQIKKHLPSLNIRAYLNMDHLGRILTDLQKEEEQNADNLTWTELCDTCEKITQDRMASVQAKYKPELYLQRDETMQEFDKFLESNSRCFVLLGKSGVGKSSFILTLERELHRKNRNDICLLAYDGGNQKMKSLKIIKRDFNARKKAERRKIKNIWKEINKIKDVQKHIFLLCIDTLNENPEPDELLIDLNELIQKGQWPWLKIVVVSRHETWKAIKRGKKLAESRYYQKRGSDNVGVILEPFTNLELPLVYAKYSKKYNLKIASL